MYTNGLRLETAKVLCILSRTGTLYTNSDLKYRVSTNEIINYIVSVYLIKMYTL